MSDTDWQEQLTDGRWRTVLSLVVVVASRSERDALLLIDALTAHADDVAATPIAAIPLQSAIEAARSALPEDKQPPPSAKERRVLRSQLPPELRGLLPPDDAA